MSLRNDNHAATPPMREPSAGHPEHPDSLLSRKASQRGPFLSLDAISACVVPGQRELPHLRGTTVQFFCDPSGGSVDSMTLAGAYRDAKSGKVVISVLRERKPPFSPEAVVEEFCEVIKSYAAHRVRNDHYAGEWPREQFRKRGITYEPCEHPKSDLYRDFLPLVNSQRVVLLDHPKLISQLSNLERRTARSGKDSIDHAPNSHDDVANAVAGVVWCVGAKAGGFKITDEMKQYRVQ
jgi:hypothetical protein